MGQRGSMGRVLCLLGVVALLLLGASGDALPPGPPPQAANSGSSHVLRYYATSVLEPGQQVPHFASVGYVNDQQIVYYDIETKKRRPKNAWITKSVEHDPQYWEWTTQRVQNAEQWFRAILVNVPKYFNQSGGLHTWQEMVCCELRKDGSKGGYWQYAYDGEDYISLDKETLTWTAASLPAQNTKRKWDPNTAFNQFTKNYLEEECIEWLRRYLEYGKKALLRTDPPKVKVTRKTDYDNLETLICRVDGFYPKDIDIAWTKGGEVWTEDTFRGIVSPNSDGTYYTWLSIKIDPKDRELYKCHVEHDGLPEHVDLAWEEPASSLGAITVYVVVAVFLIAGFAGIVWIIMYIMSNQRSNSSSRGSTAPI